MPAQAFDFATGARTAPSAIGLIRRAAVWVSARTFTVELDPHLAQDIGQDSYQVPLFPARPVGGRHE